MSPYQSFESRLEPGGGVGRANRWVPESMLLEAAVGDAIGAGYEYVKHKGIHSVDKLAYVQHPRHRGTTPGMYTDDTQMAIAIAELLLSGDEWSAYNVAEMM